MSSKRWQNYQRQNMRKKRLPQKRGWLTLATALFFLVTLFIQSQGFSFFTDKNKSTGEEVVVETVEQSSNEESVALMQQIKSQVQEVAHASEQAGTIFIGNQPLTIDVALQKKIQSIFDRYDPIYAAAVVLEAEESTVLAMVEYQSDQANELHEEFLPVKAVFPAASIFKIVTAAAGLDRGSVLPSQSLRSVGNPYRLYPNKFTEARLRRGRKISLQNALAKSDNVAFADLTSRYLNEKVLIETAKGLGFDRSIPFDLPVDESMSNLPEGGFDLAHASTGLGDMTLSPLHAALVGAAVANDGVALAPQIFRYQSRESQRPFIRIASGTAQALSLMMRRTVTHGTARKSFRGWQQHPALRDARIGGKTGTLYSRSLGGNCDWFVGYGRNSFQKISVAVILVNRPIWHVKSAYIARKILEKELNTPAVIQADI